MGGLISHYAAHRYPDVFGKAGIFSPSYWFAEQVYQYTADNPLPEQSRVYFLMGGQEGEDMVANMEKMVLQISAQRHPERNMFSKVVPEGQHNEAFWASELATALQWLFAEDARPEAPFGHAR